MRRRSILVLVLASFCGAFAAAAPQPAAPVSGLDLAGLDRSVRPQDDLYRFANGGWLARTSIPAERVSWGVFAELAERAEIDLRVIIESVVAGGPYRTGSTEQQIVDLYQSTVNGDRIEAKGGAPMQPVLDRIEAIRTPKDLATEAGVLSANGFGGPFAGAMSVDAADPTRLIVRVTQGGILLPDRDYYLGDTPTYVDARQKYEAYLVTIFTLVHRPRAQEDARAVLALETELARAHVPHVETRDQTRTFHPYTLKQLASVMPGFDWTAWAKPQGIDHAQYVSLGQPTFFKTFSALTVSTPIEVWKAWLAARYITAASAYLSEPFSNARFEFFGRVLTGQETPRARWKRGVSMVSAHVGDAIGQLYVKKHFSPAARARVQTMVRHLTAAYRQSLRTSTWLSPKARNTAIAKLSVLSAKIGYPDRWRRYDGLEVKPDDLLGNVQRAQKYQATYRQSRVGATTDTGEWLMTPQTANAYYNPALNEMVLPAAILQPPLFNMAADDAVNYGAIGGMIGHELTHAFDAEGRHYDGSGAVRNWWTPDDEREFIERTRRLASQFEAYRPLPDVPINGTLTAAENVGDLAGLSIALEGYRMSLGGKPAPVLDGFTGDQRVFLGWAQTWRSLMHESFLRQWLHHTPYSPPDFRANGPLGNIPAFYEAFDVKPGDKLFRPPDARVRIW